MKADRKGQFHRSVLPFSVWAAGARDYGSFHLEHVGGAKRTRPISRRMMATFT